MSDEDNRKPPPRLFKTEADYYRHEARLQSYRDYRRNHREKCRAKGRERMARLRTAPTDEQRAKHRAAQARYRERFREQIAHRARRAAVKKNSLAGKKTILRPKARQYWSDEELDSSSEEEEDCDNVDTSPPFGRPAQLEEFEHSPPRSEPPVPLAARALITGACGASTSAASWAHGSGCGKSLLPRRAVLTQPLVFEPGLVTVQVAGGESDGGNGSGGCQTCESAPTECEELVVASDGGSISILPGLTDFGLLVWVAFEPDAGTPLPGHFETHEAMAMEHLSSLALILTMSAPQSALRPVNLAPEEMCMDQRGVQDARYYCLPPWRGSTTASAAGQRRGGKYPLYLVAQSHMVGTFDSWIEAKASISGFADNSYQGCHTEAEAIALWQGLCPLGVHPHPVDPTMLVPPSASASAFVNTSPRKSVRPNASPVKRESSAEVLADLQRSEQRYREMQLRGEEPDMLVTRSFEQATLFALENEADGDEEF
ncbi:hypothetical protein DFH07DRAFT_763792 [Mycena maculata]|uniref:Ribonuclease H1 N-terminal domain-containing protein n=1 Tax=Mycena maculata TaxID=230809 RepID=A0AAD7P2F9_9AGAR|nr:hypothetical protein DFH07DRAFT_763792 [Mycena maculata]